MIHEQACFGVQIFGAIVVRAAVRMGTALAHPPIPIPLVIGVKDP